MRTCFVSITQVLFFFNKCVLTLHCMIKNLFVLTPFFHCRWKTQMKYLSRRKTNLQF